MANNNSKLSRSIETLNFLKEYAQDSNRNFEDVAQKIGISEQNAESYLRKYIYLVKNTEKDKDFPRRARLVLNNNVPNEFHITDEELITLKTLVTEYDFDTSINDESQNQGQGLNFDPHSKSSMIRKSIDNDKNNDPREQNSPDYARLPMSSRSDILRYVLNKFTHVHFSKKEPFISLFEADEPNLVADPMKLQKVMVNYFGPNLGDAIFERFSEMVRGNLPAYEHLGNNPWRSPMGGMQGGLGMGGMAGMSPYANNYYAAIAVIPMGVDLYSPKARQAIDEYERKKRASENSGNSG